MTDAQRVPLSKNRFAATLTATIAVAATLTSLTATPAAAAVLTPAGPDCTTERAAYITARNAADAVQSDLLDAASDLNAARAAFDASRTPGNKTALDQAAGVLNAARSALRSYDADVLAPAKAAHTAAAYSANNARTFYVYRRDVAAQLDADLQTLRRQYELLLADPDLAPDALAGAAQQLENQQAVRDSWMGLRNDALKDFRSALTALQSSAEQAALDSAKAGRVPLATAVQEAQGPYSAASTAYNASRTADNKAAVDDATAAYNTAHAPRAASNAALHVYRACLNPPTLRFTNVHWDPTTNTVRGAINATGLKPGADYYTSPATSWRAFGLPDNSSLTGFTADSAGGAQRADYWIDFQICSILGDSRIIQLYSSESPDSPLDEVTISADCANTP